MWYTFQKGDVREYAKFKKNLSNFSLRLKEARAEIYTQQQLAEKSGVSLKTIQRLENFESLVAMVRNIAGTYPKAC